MLKRTTKILIIAFSMLTAASVQAYTIDDNYIGADGHGFGDVIGGSDYNIQGMDVNFASGMMNVRVYTNFDASVDPYGVDFGDLFISVDGWNPNTSTANYSSDNAATGESWEFAFDTSLNGLYGGNFSILNSENFFDPNRYYFRNGQEVQIAGGTLFAGSSVDLSHVGVGGYIDYSISMASLGVSSGSNIGLKWGMTCANDTIEGVVTVAEPMSVLLFGVGLLGLGATRRKFS